MKDNNSQIMKIHSTVIMIVTIACIAVVSESIVQDWEFWVPPLIIGALIGEWILHIFQYRTLRERENYYLIFGMALVFFQGVHHSNFFDIIAMSVVFMTTAVLLKRRGFLNLIFTEYFIIMAVQLALENRYSEPQFDAATLARVFLHVACEVCCFIILKRVLYVALENRQILDGKTDDYLKLKSDNEDLLLSISRTLSEEKDAARLSQRIGDIGEYSRICRGCLETCSEEYSIVPVIESVVTDIDKRVARPNVDFVVDLDPSVPVRLKGDVTKLRMIMEHLLDNAFRFTKRGSVYLRISGIRHEERFNLVIDVADTGKGMSASSVYAAANGQLISNCDGDEERGIGIGLAIVYGYARSMNGFAGIESEEGGGTNVRISVPQEITDPAPCMELTNKKFLNVVCMLDTEVRRHSRTVQAYKNMADNMAESLRFNLYYASSSRDIKRYVERGNVTTIIMGLKDYEASRKYISNLPSGITVIVCNCDQSTVPPTIVALNRPVFSKKIFDVLNSKDTAPLQEGGRV